LINEKVIYYFIFNSILNSFLLVCKVIFEHPLMNQHDEIQIEFVDTKTIVFVTPPCPIQANGHQRIYIPIVVTQSGEEIARVNFLYQSCE